jgi:hypothetical protein
MIGVGNLPTADAVTKPSYINAQNGKNELSEWISVQIPIVDGTSLPE